MKRILFATGNVDKVREISEILAGTGIEILSLKEAGLDIDIEENGTTFEENAAIKAKTAAEMSGEIALADDSGLMIDAFDGGPGVYSARFLGHNTSYEEKNDYILEKLKDVPDEKRGAKFVCVAALAFPDERATITRRGEMKGRIAREKSGANGFGFDPIFFLPEYGCTSATLSPDDKNAISHRGKAFRAIKEVIEVLTGGR